MKVVPTRAGARIVEAGTVVSEILREPGPSHTLFDVLAAAVASLSPGPRVLLLGFAGGGIVAPLRAMGFHDALEAVDLSLEGARLFRRLSGRWIGEVEIRQAEASAWIAGNRRRWDLVVEDLFMDGPAGMAKPEVCRTVIPGLLARRLGSRGVAVVNVLPVPRSSWSKVLAPLAAPYAEGYLVTLKDYENKLLIGGRGLGGARKISAGLRSALRSIRSRQARRVSVASL